jgi:F-type H+-transporting ATPase subunit delta
MEATHLARPYAQAAFEYATAQQQITAWSVLLEALSQIASQAKVQELLKDPRYTVQQLAEIVIALAEIEPTKEEQNFIYLLAEKRRLTLLPQIAALFVEYRAAHEKQITVEVSSALPLSEQQQQALSQVLSKRLKLDVTLNCKVEPDLLGGLRLRMGDKVIDSSIRGQLSRLKTTLLG